MKYKRLVPSLLLTGVIVGLLTTPTLSEEKSSIGVDKSTASGEKSARSTQQPRLVTNSRFVKPITEIRSLSEIERPITSAQMLVQSPTPQATPTSGVVEVTGVKANPTKKGVEVILQTPKGQALQLVNRSAGNNFVVDIPNAQLRLPSGDAFTFRSTKPIAGVTEITVTNFDANTIRVTVTGEAGVPTVELFDSPNEGIIFSVASTSQRAQQGQPQTQQSPAQQPDSQKMPTQPSASGDEPIELVVTGEQDGYNSSVSTTGTKVDTNQRDIPQAIQVVPRQVIQDQQITRVGDAVRNLSGVQVQAGGSRSTFDRFYFRGFSNVNDGVLRNGLRDRIGSRVPSETANLERIEVLKGPGSVLYGQGILGGAVNLITKQPRQDPYYSIEGTFGNFDFYRGAVDLSGPLTSDKTLLYRLNASVESSGTFIDFFDTQRYFIAPVLSWQIGKNTKLTLEAEYLDSQLQDDNGLPAVGTVLPNPNGKIPLNRNINEPDDKDNRTALRVGYNFEHRFSENWQIRNAFQSTFSKVDQKFTSPTALLADNRTLQRGSFFDSQGSTSTNTYTMDTYVVGKFKTGSIQHQLVTGFDLFRQTDFTPDGLNSSQAPLDLFNPVYGRPQGPVSRFDSGITSQALGIYIQDQITFADNLKLLLGGRFDLVNQKQENFVAATTTFQQDEAFTPRVGIVYQPIPEISLYASYGKAFQQNYGTTLDNTLFTPERGTQYEVGVKADLSDKVSATLAFYDLTRSNVIVPNPNNTRFSILTGEQRSRGIEFDIAGEVLPGWNIIAAYAYTDAIVTKDTRPLLVDNQLNNIPKHSFSVWTTYTLQSSFLQGLGFGLGLFYVGDRQGDLANTFELPNYLRTDAALFYKRNNFRAAVNIKNLFDITYFESANSNLRVYPGAPLTVQGTIGWEF
ncbi:TonB-dependent siderophore receptor [Brasilonema bromeliae]|uniref:TonB-dependent siderophore receptor n=1 Tax=Brasilonema bromeliae SPC951 TaxID=385972 RepID=A0ABX1PFJ2_9CYAN|nr:TonB-dependent siderophore receptor [Brasilonema bromeliae]NMG22718.1 TonB-dependent siderophore receptor [Brasilonema bromeliae SPC951]